MGLWSADFVVEKSSDPGIKPFKGFLRLFGNEKYQLHFENSVQSFEVSGKWHLGSSRLTMTVDKIDYQNPSELDQQTMSLKPIAVPDVRDAYGRQFFLKMTDGDTGLQGLAMRLGPLVGYQVFKKRHLDQG